VHGDLNRAHPDDRTVNTSAVCLWTMNYDLVKALERGAGVLWRLNFGWRAFRVSQHSRADTQGLSVHSPAVDLPW
jgi:hypothetical protein